MPLTISIRQAAPWNEPTGLRYIASSDGLGTSAHLPPATDLAEAMNWFYGVVTGQVAPAGGALVPTVGANNTWSGTNTFNAATTLAGSVSVSGAATFTHGITFTGVATPITISSVSLARVQATTPVVVSGWTPALFGGLFRYNDGATGSLLIVPLDLPHGSELTSVSVDLAGSGTDVGLPASMPTIFVYYLPIAGGSATALGNQTDGSASLAAYQAQHALTVSGLTHTVDRTVNKYYAAFTSESGAGANSGSHYYGCSVTYSRTTIGLD